MQGRDCDVTPLPAASLPAPFPAATCGKSSAGCWAPVGRTRPGQVRRLRSARAARGSGRLALPLPSQSPPPSAGSRISPTGHVVKEGDPPELRAAGCRVRVQESSDAKPQGPRRRGSRRGGRKGLGSARGWCAHGVLGLLTAARCALRMGNEFYFINVL